MPAPKHRLPASRGHTVRVSVINGARSWLPASFLVSNPMKGHDKIHLSDYSFLIESSNTDQKVLFDLAMMKDVNTRMPPALKAIFENGPGEAQVSKDVPKQLTENNIPLSTINAIIWSHSHIDHVGDPSLFPSSACLIHGPGTARPGYPTNPDAFLLESAFTGRSVRQLDFEKDSTLEIRGLNAIDYFDDGSFYILSAAGHTADHVLGLARTGDDEWVLMAADSYHHPGQLRPSRYLRLPDDEASLKFRELLPNGVTEPFYGLPEHLHDDIQKAQSLITKLQIFDADERVLCIIAHDMSMLEDLSLLPDVLNGWKVKGALKETTRWKFLKDFEEALKVHQS